jgi:hypothetical protein
MGHIPLRYLQGITGMSFALAALKLIKECNEGIFHLIDEGPSIMYLKQLQEKLIQIENRRIR